jgi:hypothetical protein
MLATVVACVHSAYERAAVLNGSSGCVVRLCTDVIGTREALNRAAVVGLIVEVHPALGPDLDIIISAARALAFRLPIIVRLAPMPSAMTRFLSSQQLRSGYVSLIGAVCI